MTRFDAADPADRRKLFVDAITAHRTRASPFLTIEVDKETLESDDPKLDAPWLQFADGIVNLDCTDAELESLKDLLGEFPAFKIDEITRSDSTEGVNVRVSAKADPNRIAQFVDATFQRVYDCPDEFRAWVVAV
ncbi:hypothetical protein [Natrialbaceae archaeon AArc-T1-2]|uniref:hypothetical protein n=1 Tax=Natrialbaceae archaeon AArc-T1-2 TaxID=3053904 RepID=UPI00255ABB14|nr:hypothetical protein [Natrialbaceae archaeon AArc-T1-2]WIV67945.1 hypothetical protein QQ977_04220 [Natrialbaceae archaeon AArc-T1-2]